jgi:tRNA(fMet)-specific endonuclease VapC
MTRHLLDSDAIIDVLKGVSDTLALLGTLIQQGNTLAICDVALGEVYAGLHQQDEARAAQFLSTLEFLPASASAAHQAGQWRYNYARRGTTLSITDCLIAATAAEHHAVIVTGNAKDFPMPEVTTLPLLRPTRQSKRR